MSEQSSNSKPKKIPKAMIYREIARTMNGEVSALNRLPKKFACVERDNKRIPYHLTSDNVLRISSLQEIADTIQVFCQDDPSVSCNESYALLPKDCIDCAKLWLSTAPIISEDFIEMVRFKNEPGYCYRRLPWDYNPDGPTPNFDELLGRFTNTEALRHWIGALFEQKAYRQQYVYIHGPGKSGKGSLGYFIFKAFDSAAQLLDTNIGYAHWTSSILDKRFGFFDDVDLQILGWGKFRQLTGGPKMPVNMKYEKPFTADNNCMFLFTSNYEPQFSGESEDVRRIILCRTEKPSKINLSEFEYEEALWAEGGYFLSKCLKEYREKYKPKYGMIDCELEGAQEIARTYEWQMNYVTEFFAKSRQRIMLASDFRAAVYKICRRCEFKWSDQHFGKFKKYLEREEIAEWIEIDRKRYVRGLTCDGYANLLYKNQLELVKNNTGSVNLQQ